MFIFIKAERYFEKDQDKRSAKKSFNFDVFDLFQKEVLSKKEVKKIEKLNSGYQKRVKSLPKTILEKEIERLTIELSWKSSKIEGNTYTVLETEALIKEKKTAQGRTLEEAKMILNHKDALDFIFFNKAHFKKLSLVKIENLHKLIIHDLGIEKNIRKRLVGITGTEYQPLDNQFQIKEALEKMVKIVNNPRLHPFQKALATVLLISYVQPFEDGNKRTARLLGNAILLANGYCPLSYRDVEVGDYKRATLLFYEQNDPIYFKQIFLEQFEFAVNNYFG